MKNFSIPAIEVIRFDGNAIKTSVCTCNFMGETFPGCLSFDCPNKNDPLCTCITNTDNPALGNCA